MTTMALEESLFQVSKKNIRLLFWSNPDFSSLSSPNSECWDKPYTYVTKLTTLEQFWEKCRFILFLQFKV